MPSLITHYEFSKQNFPKHKKIFYLEREYISQNISHFPDNRQYDKFSHFILFISINFGIGTKIVLQNIPSAGV